MDIELYEDDVGGLTLWLHREGRGWDVSAVDPADYDVYNAPSAWAAAVRAINRGETSDWTVPEVTEPPPVSDLVAWDDGDTRGAHPRNMGRAALAYVYGVWADDGEPARPRCDGETLRALDASGHAGECPACGYSSPQAFEDAVDHLRRFGEPSRVRGDRREGGDKRATWSDGENAWAPCWCGLLLSGGCASVAEWAWRGAV